MPLTSTERDIAAVQRIASIPRILDAVTHLTGMRFAAVARVTDTTWTACAVLDTLGFGLRPGDELELATTICNEIREHHQPVVFGHAREHPVYSQHHTPQLYGLESYASVPIFRRDDTFFGTLCAIDSRPAALASPAIVQSLELFAQLIGLQLELIDDVDRLQTDLDDAVLRETVLTSTERDIRDLLQPVMGGLYLLEHSGTLNEQDRALVREIDASCKDITRLLRDKVDARQGRLVPAAPLHRSA